MVISKYDFYQYEFFTLFNQDERLAWLYAQLHMLGRTKQQKEYIYAEFVEYFNVPEVLNEKWIKENPGPYDFYKYFHSIEEYEKNFFGLQEAIKNDKHHPDNK